MCIICYDIRYDMIVDDNNDCFPSQSLITSLTYSRILDYSVVYWVVFGLTALISVALNHRRISQWHIAPRSRCLSVNHSMSYLTFPRKGNDTDSIIICARIFRNFPRLRKLDVLWTVKLNIPVSYIMGKKGFAAFIKDFYNDPFKWWVKFLHT